MNSRMEMISIYQETLNQVLRRKETDRGEDEKSLRDLRQLGEMESDLRYVMEWLIGEREPGPRRNIERRSQEQRTVYLSEAQLEQAARRSNLRTGPPSGQTLPAEKQRMLEQAMKLLSPQEHRAFTLVYGNCFSVRETADLMGVRETTVKTLILRARRKFERMLESNTPESRAE